MTNPERHGVRAVVVTWNPDVARLIEAVRALVSQTDGVIIIDNGSANLGEVVEQFSSSETVKVVGLGENRGIGAALNAGVALALGSGPAWIMTMDQDTLVAEGSVAGILTDFASLEESLQRRCGILALRPHPQPASIWLTRYAESLMVIGDIGPFIERRGVITSGNLVPAELVQQVHFNESMFIDQVDFDFCHSLRERGHVVLQQKSITMDHILGERYDDVERIHPYENAQRMYYIIRNSTYLVLRRRLGVRFYFVQAVVFSGAFVSINGVGSVGHCIAVLVRGIFDGAAGRMGRREYRLLQRGRK